MTHITEARVIGNHAAMGRSIPAAADTPYLTVYEILRAGACRAAERKDMAAAQSKWDSEGGANEAVSSAEGLGAVSGAEGSSETARRRVLGRAA